MNLLYEHMIRVESNGYICRIWRTDEISYINFEKFAAGVLNNNGPMSTMVTDIVSLDGVNSVEIVFKRTGCGICVHKDWP